MKEIKREVMQWVKEEIARSHWTHEEFAEALNESSSTVKKWLSSDKFPQPIRAQKLLLFITDDITETDIFKNASFGHKMFLLRMREGMNVEQTSSSMAVSHVLLRGWEKGTNTPTKVYIRKILAFYNVSSEKMGVRSEEESFGQRLKDQRMMLDLTQERVAKRIGVSQARLSCYESNTYIPGVRVLKSIMTILGDEAADIIIATDGFPLPGFESHYFALERDYAREYDSIQ